MVTALPLEAKATATVRAFAARAPNHAAVAAFVAVAGRSVADGCGDLG